MLSVKHHSVAYGQSTIIGDLNLEVGKNEIVAVVGRNGMGKTTLLKCVMGLLPVSTGSIHLGEKDITAVAADRRASLGVGYVPQGREIFGQLSVEENLRLGQYVRKDNGAEALERVYQTFPVLKKMARRRGGDLSGGQQQQLAIGRALIFDPKLLILDEPCEGIQPNIVAEIGDLLIRLNQDTGLTVLLVEQKLPFARRVASEFRILDKGRLVAGGDISELSDTLVERHLSV